jgi:hypothetical protein
MGFVPFILILDIIQENPDGEINADFAGITLNGDV